MIIEDVKAAGGKNPAEIFRAIAKKSYINIHGPEHHVLDGACILMAFYNAGDKNLLLVSAGMNPIIFYEKVELSSEITDTHFIAMVCSDEEIRKRLKARPAERNCGSDEFIQSQIEYAAWFKKNRGKFRKFIDNTGQMSEETAEIIAEYVKSRLG